MRDGCRPPRWGADRAKKSIGQRQALGKWQLLVAPAARRIRADREGPRPAGAQGLGAEAHERPTLTLTDLTGTAEYPQRSLIDRTAWPDGSRPPAMSDFS